MTDLVDTKIKLNEDNEIFLETLKEFAYQIAGVTSAVCMSHHPNMVFPEAFPPDEVKAGIFNVIQNFDFTKTYDKIIYDG